MSRISPPIRTSLRGAPMWKAVPRIRRCWRLLVQMACRACRRHYRRLESSATARATRGATMQFGMPSHGFDGLRAMTFFLSLFLLRLGQVLPHPRLHDFRHQCVGKGLIERKYQVAFWPRILCRGGYQLRVVSDRREHPNVILEGREIDQEAVQSERGHPVTDDFLGLRRRCLLNRGAQFP